MDGIAFQGIFSRSLNFTSASITSMRLHQFFLKPLTMTNEKYAWRFEFRERIASVASFKTVCRHKS